MVKTYEIYTRMNGIENILLVTQRAEEAKAFYSRMLIQHCCPRVRVNGIDAPIVDADYWAAKGSYCKELKIGCKAEAVQEANRKSKIRAKKSYENRK